MKEKLSKGVILSLAGGDLYCKQFQLSALLWATSKGGGEGGRAGWGGPGNVVVLFSPFWGFLFICTWRCLFSRFIWYSFFFPFPTDRQCRMESGEMYTTVVSVKEEVVRLQAFGVGLGNKLSAVPFLLFRPPVLPPHAHTHSPFTPPTLPPPSPPH